MRILPLQQRLRRTRRSGFAFTVLYLCTSCSGKASSDLDQTPECKSVPAPRITLEPGTSTTGDTSWAAVYSNLSDSPLLIDPPEKARCSYGDSQGGTVSVVGLNWSTPFVLSPGARSEPMLLIFQADAPGTSDSVGVRINLQYRASADAKECTTAGVVEATWVAGSAQPE